MSHHLPPHVSFAFLGGGAVLLDIETDRYLMLRGAEAGALEALAAIGRSSCCPDPALVRLTARGLLAEGPGAAVSPISVPTPTASALELAGQTERASALEIARYRAEASLRLRFQGLGATMTRWRALKVHQRLGRTAGNSDPGVIARGYAAARVQLPWRRLCVPDSLALARYLWKRNIDCDVLFGVRLDPFAAHAWVQSGDLLLSDNINVVADYTPVFRL